MVVKQVFDHSFRESGKRFFGSLKASNRYSEGYLASLETTVAMAALYAEEQRWPGVREITVSHIEDYRAYLQGRTRWFGERTYAEPRKLSKSHINVQYRHLHRFFNWLVEREYADSNPLQLIKPPSLDEKTVPVVTEDQVRERQGQEHPPGLFLRLAAVPDVGRGRRPPPLPAAPQAVALYLGHLASTGRSIATVQQARSAISHFHAAAGMGKGDNPALHPVVSEAVKGWRNRAPAPRQAGALTADALARVREVLRLPKRGRGGRMESADTAGRRGALDLAIIGVLADGGLRRSEAADLPWGDVELWADGTGRLTIQKGKNQVEPATVAVTAATARALRDIRPDDVDLAAPVFGLTGETLGNRVHAAARAAGLGDGFTGHSGRIGMARRMVAAGAPNAAVQRQGRWKHGDMVARYTRGEAAGEALKWLT